MCKYILNYSNIVKVLQIWIIAGARPSKFSAQSKDWECGYFQHIPEFVQRTPVVHCGCETQHPQVDHSLVMGGTKGRSPVPVFVRPAVPVMNPGNSPNLLDGFSWFMGGPLVHLNQKRIAWWSRSRVGTSKPCCAACGAAPHSKSLLPNWIVCICFSLFLDMLRFFFSHQINPNQFMELVGNFWNFILHPIDGWIELCHLLHLCKLVVRACVLAAATLRLWNLSFHSLHACRSSFSIPTKQLTIPESKSKEAPRQRAMAIHLEVPCFFLPLLFCSHFSAFQAVLHTLGIWVRWVLIIQAKALVTNLQVGKPTKSGCFIYVPLINDAETG